MSVTESSLAARVDALCGDLSRVRAPRGVELNARQWSTEAPLRMLLNNLDAEVAEKPEELVVYGGCGRAALRLAGSQRAHDPDGRARRDGRRTAARGDHGGRGGAVHRGRPASHRAAPRDALSR